jgi:hypothetical protein
MVQSKVRKSVVDALMALATEKRWHDISLNEIAERAGMTPGALRAAYDGGSPSSKISCAASTSACWPASTRT